MGSTHGEVDLENQELVPPVVVSRGGCWQITRFLNLIHSVWQFLTFTKANNHIKSSPAVDESEVSFRVPIQNFILELLFHLICIFRLIL